MSINDKIKQVLTVKSLSPSHLADDIGVQRSSISHILSGRNRPSLDIIQKLVRRFPEFTYEWFLEDDIQVSTLPLPTAGLNVPDQPAPSAVPWLATTDQSTEPVAEPALAVTATGQQIRSNNVENEMSIPKQNVAPLLSKTIDRILIFYSDGTFQAYVPA